MGMHQHVLHVIAWLFLLGKVGPFNAHPLAANDRRDRGSVQRELHVRDDPDRGVPFIATESLRRSPGRRGEVRVALSSVTRWAGRLVSAQAISTPGFRQSRSAHRPRGNRNRRATGSRRKFSAHFRHPSIALRQVVGERHRRIDRKQDVRLYGCWMQQQTYQPGVAHGPAACWRWRSTRLRSWNAKPSVRTGYRNIVRTVPDEAGDSATFRSRARSLPAWLPGNRCCIFARAQSSFSISTSVSPAVCADGSAGCTMRAIRLSECTASSGRGRQCSRTFSSRPPRFGETR